MFSTLLRGALTLVGFALLYVPFKMAGDAIESTVHDFGVAGSETARWIGMTVTWIPLVVLAVIAIQMVTGAAARRGAF